MHARRGRVSVRVAGNHEIGNAAAHIAREHVVVLLRTLGACALLAISRDGGRALDLLGRTSIGGEQRGGRATGGQRDGEKPRGKQNGDLGEIFHGSRLTGSREYNAALRQCTRGCPTAPRAWRMPRISGAPGGRQPFQTTPAPSGGGGSSPASRCRRSVRRLSNTISATPIQIGTYVHSPLSVKGSPSRKTETAKSSTGST